MQFRKKTWIENLASLLGVLALGLGAVACERVASAQTPAQAEEFIGPQEAPLAQLRSSRAEETLWWGYAGEVGGAGVSFSPALLDPDGSLVRLWSLTCVKPQTSSPLTCLGGVVYCDSSDPMELEREHLKLHFKPKDGLTWGQVQTRDELETLVVGL